MTRTLLLTTLSAAFTAALAQTAAPGARQWTLANCVEHALTHNIALQKAKTGVETQRINVKEQKAGLLPSLSANVLQGLNYRPFTSSSSSIVNGGIASSSTAHFNYNGSYGVSANWTVWNGGRNRRSIASAQLSQDIAELDVATSSNGVVEQIANYYIQILYMEEAARVNEALLVQDSTLYARGLDMVQQGQMSRSDLVQLEAQVASGRYDVVNTRTQIAQAKLQLKQLLELSPTDEFAVASTTLTDQAALRLVPDRMSVYAAALDNRPEVKRSQLSIQQSALETQIAQAQHLPTLSVNGSLSDSHVSGSTQNLGHQMKNNLSLGVGIGLSIPLLDNRSAKSAVERAKVNETLAKLDLENTKKELYQTIETYWLNAVNNQQKFVAARKTAESAIATYGLVSDQYKYGTKNIVDLLTSRETMLKAQQQLLQDKYTTILNQMLLDYYQGSEMTL